MSNFRHNGYLIHYNHNHDALGRFARSSGGSGKRAIRKADKAIKKDSKKADKNDHRINKLEAKERKKFLKPGQGYAPTDYSGEINKGRNITNRSRVAKNYHRSLARDPKLSDLENRYLKAFDKAEREMDKPNNTINTQKAWNAVDKRESEYRSYMKNRGEKYSKKYAQATINDLHLKNTPEVEQFIVDNMDWNTIGRYDNTTRLTKHKKKQIIS